MVAGSKLGKEGRFARVFQGEAMPLLSDQKKAVEFFQKEMGLSLKEALHAALVVRKHLHGKLNSRKARSKKERRKEQK